MCCFVVFVMEDVVIVFFLVDGDGDGLVQCVVVLLLFGCVVVVDYWVQLVEVEILVGDVYCYWQLEVVFVEEVFDFVGVVMVYGQVDVLVCVVYFRQVEIVLFEQFFDWYFFFDVDGYDFVDEGYVLVVVGQLICFGVVFVVFVWIGVDVVVGVVVYYVLVVLYVFCYYEGVVVDGLLVLV